MRTSNSTRKRKYLSIADKTGQKKKELRYAFSAQINVNMPYENSLINGLITYHVAIS